MFTVMFAGLLGKLFQTRTLDGNEYQKTYMQRTEKNVTMPGSRGSILNRNGSRLAHNELAYSVIVQDLGNYPHPSSHSQILYHLVRTLDQRGEIMEGKFEIALDQNDEMFFTSSSGFAKTRFFLNFYGLSSTADLNDPKGRYPTNITTRETFECREVDHELDKMKDEKGNSLVIPDNIVPGVINVIYTTKLTEYQKYETTTVATNVSNEIIVEINGDTADLKGVKMEQSYVHKYEDSIYFTSIIGYTGKVQEDRLSTLNEQWHQSDEAAGLPEGTPDRYDPDGIVGRIGVGKSMELEPQSEKGYSRMYVDNMRCPREVIEKTDAKAGDNIHLTISRDLQIAIYKLTEQQLAGIVSYHLQYDDLDPNKTYDPSKIPIPVENAYHQLANNNMLSLMDMSQEGASDIEKQIYSKYEAFREQILTAIRNELLSSHALAMNDLPRGMATHMNYTYVYLPDGSVGIIQKGKVDQSSSEYQAWRKGTIGLRDYIYSGIAGNWVDTTRLDVTNKYSNADDIFTQLVDHVIESLCNGDRFTKHVFRCLINDKVIMGRELRLALYAQGVPTYDAQVIAVLQMRDSIYVYQSIKEKISDLEPTPAQLVLDPCTARVVVTDAKAGEIRALVTYSGYDNNLVSGNMDVAYFSQLQDDMSRPLYNNVARVQKIPGSTFKPVTAVAALEKGVMGLQNTIECTSIYDQISKPTKCWIWPGRHNSENIKEGIQNSCNYFFTELAHRPCMKSNGIYPPDQDLATLCRYATLFGLDHTSGVEISENKPQISSENPGRSAVGQSTHSYTNVQLFYYVVTLANRGNASELSLLDELTDSDGNLIKDYIPAVGSYVNTTGSIWDAVQIGMCWVITNNSAKGTFSDLPAEVAGKTGTAQEDKSRSNHAFFVSFTPYSHSEIVMTVNIPYGYTRTNAATLGEKVHEYRYEYAILEQIGSLDVLGVSNVSIGD